MQRSHEKQVGDGVAASSEVVELGFENRCFDLRDFELLFVAADACFSFESGSSERTSSP